LPTPGLFLTDHGNQDLSHPLRKTGDLVRDSSDDNFIYVGRKGAQAKRNGIRIDVSEASHCLKSALGGLWVVVCDMISPVELQGRKFLATFLHDHESTEYSARDHEYLANVSDNL
jgi:hypothetical protein